MAYIDAGALGRRTKFLLFCVSKLDQDSLSDGEVCVL